MKAEHEKAVELYFEVDTKKVIFDTERQQYMDMDKTT